MPTDEQVAGALDALSREVELRQAVERAHAAFQVRPSEAAAAALEASITDWRSNDESQLNPG